MTPSELAELNELMATKIMGWEKTADVVGEYWAEPKKYPDGPRYIIMGISSYDPTTNVGQAMMVAEALREKGWRGRIMLQPRLHHCLGTPVSGARFSATFSSTLDSLIAASHKLRFGEAEAEADTLPLAVCLAAKQVAEVEG